MISYGAYVQDVRRAATAIVLVGTEVATLVLLVRLGSVPGFAIEWADPAGWLARTTPEDAAAAVLRVMAIGGAGWLLLSTLLCLAASARPGGSTGSLARAVTGRGVVRILERVLAISLVTGTTFGPAAAIGAGPPSPPVEIDVRTGRAETEEAVPTVEPTPVPTPAPPLVPVATPETSVEHVVQPGECLWSIAADELALTTARTRDAIADAEVAAYWVELMAANHGRLASGDPNLIYPGEVVLLPR